MKQLFKFGLKDGKLYSVVGLPFADARSIGLEGATGRLLLGGNTNDIYIAKHKLSKPEEPITWRLLSKSLVPYHSETIAVFNDDTFYEQRLGRDIFKHTISFPIIGHGQLIYTSDDSMGVSVGYGTIWAVDNTSNEIVGVDGTAIGQATTCLSTHLSSIATDFYSVYPNNEDVYRIYAADHLGRRLHRATLNIATNTLSDYVYYENIFDVDNPYGVGIDGHNNVWCFGQGTSVITKIYRLEDSATFPIGGDCRYPTCRLNDYTASQNAAFNDQTIEWFLLRDPEFMDTHAQRAYYALLVDYVENEVSISPSSTRYYAGKTVAGFTREEKIQNVEDWVRTFGMDDVEIPTRLYGWGNNDDGQVSNAPDSYGWVMVLGGAWHSIALHENGTMKSWGLDSSGVVSNTPSNDGWQSIASGLWHSLALHENGTIASWGQDDYGQVSSTPGGAGWKAVAGGWKHSLALHENGTIVSWGDDTYNQVTNTPIGSGWTSIAGGGNHSLALHESGTIISWGRDDYGQVSSTPGGAGWVAISGGQAHSLALHENGTLVSWGRDEVGQVTDTPSGGDWIYVGCGVDHSFAIRDRLDNCQGRKVFPNYDGASISNVGDKYATVTPLTSMSPPKALSDFTGKVAIDSTTLITEMMMTDNPEDVYESESSSSSVMNNTYYPKRYRTYVSNCKSLSAINNPMAGTEVGMIYSGYFDIAHNMSTEPLHESKHIETGGLRRSVVNNGMIYCNNAAKLFSMRAGGVSLTLNLPQAIKDGIYDELADGNGGLIKDKLIWAVNMGDAYITQPGLYAAFTPSGLEFTSWSHLSKTTVLDTSINISENTDFILDFVWNKNGLLDDVPDVNVAIFLNGELKSWSSGLIGDDSLENLYSRKGSTPKHADFCLMGNKSRLLTIDGIIRRIETYTARPSSSSETSSEGSLSSSSQSQDRIGRANASLPISFTGTREPVAIIRDVKFGTVISQTTDLGLTKESGSFLHQHGEDKGQSIEANVVFPKAGIDLPPGFDLVFKL